MDWWQNTKTKTKNPITQLRSIHYGSLSKLEGGGCTLPTGIWSWERSSWTNIGFAPQTSLGSVSSVLPCFGASSPWDPHGHRNIQSQWCRWFVIWRALSPSLLVEVIVPVLREVLLFALTRGTWDQRGERVWPRSLNVLVARLMIRLSTSNRFFLHLQSICSAFCWEREAGHNGSALLAFVSWQEWGLLQLLCRDSSG